LSDDLGTSSNTRLLTDAERRLARWMLENGTPEARSFLPQLEDAEATLWRCPCGCASFNLRTKAHLDPPPAKHLHILGDFLFGGLEDLCGVFIFEDAGILRGVEVYGGAGDHPKVLPSPESLRPFTAASRHERPSGGNAGS
jgi:hypothetical protein